MTAVLPTPQVKSAVTVGVAPVPHGTPPQMATAITNVSHATFVSGMSAAFLVAAAVALAGAVLAVLAKRGRPAEEAVVI